MSTDFGTRLARIEAVLERFAPRDIGIAERLERARLAADGRGARGEPEPAWVPLVPNPAASWECQEITRRLNAAHLRMHPPEPTP